MNEQNTNPEQVEGEPFSPLKSNHTGLAAIAYLLFFVPLLTDHKDDSFVKFHVRQGFLVFLLAISASLLNMTIILIPVAIVLHIAAVALAILGIVYALRGEEKLLPFLGQFIDKVPF